MTRPRRSSTSSSCWSTPRAPTSWRVSSNAATGPIRRRSSGAAKAEELRDLCLAVDADTVVFTNDLTPAQQYNLEKLLGRTAIERTAVILDIFAQNAHTLEGRAQVELALLQYRLPRLRRGAKGRLSQQGGGIGTRQGPGETKLETDRRRLTRRIARLQHDLADLQRNRQLQRRSRSRSGLANVTIVGYTNAGKSTLLNRLTTAGVLVENRLFATLDPTTRRLSLPGGEPVLLTDTVGFVRRLPHGLVEAFKSTLEVVAEADLLIHVVDASSPDPEAQIDAVHAVLGEIHAGEVPELLVFNKADLAPEEARRQVKLHPGSVALSSTTGRGVDDLLTAVSDRLRAVAEVVELLVPYDRGDVLAALHREGEVLTSVHEDAGIHVRARLSRPSVGRLAEFVVRDATLAAAVGGLPTPLTRATRRADRLRAAALPVRPARHPGRAGGPAPGRRRGPLGRDAVRPAAGVGGCRALVLRQRAGLPAQHRDARAARRGEQVAGAAVRGGRAPVADRGLRRHEGARRHPSPVAPAAPARPRHRAPPRDLLPDLRDGSHAGRLPRRCRAGRRGPAPAPRRHRSR